MPQHFRQSLIFTGFFVVFTIVGTLTHELGHTMVAKWYGYQTILHYGSMSWYSGPFDDHLDTIMANYDLKIEQDLGSPVFREYDQLLAHRRDHQLGILTGGPIQTMFTGLVGFLILLARKDKYLRSSFKWFDWLAVFLALFWLREIFNPVFALIKFLFGQPSNTNGDEFRLSRSLGLNEWALPIVLGLLGSAIVVFVIFRIVPRHNRITFIMGGIIGGLVGFWLWMKVLGPIVLP